MPLAKIAFPANAYASLSIIRDIVTFDILPTDFIKDDIFEFSNTQTYSTFFDIDIFVIIYLL